MTINQPLFFRFSFLLVIIFFFSSCKDDRTVVNNVDAAQNEVLEIQPDHILVIAKNAPAAYNSYFKKDSLGKGLKSGPYANFPDASLSYLDDQNIFRKWFPKPNSIDTLNIPLSRSFLELSTTHPSAAIPSSFLVKNGDTVVIEYIDKVAHAQLINRSVPAVELNYDAFRANTLFPDTYSPHNIFLSAVGRGENLSFSEANKQAVIESDSMAYKEQKMLDSLLQDRVITHDFYDYRSTLVNAIIENNHFKDPTFLSKNLLENNSEESLKDNAFAKADSLMNYSFYRRKISRELKFNLPIIKVNRQSSGSFFIDHRIQFDSIANSPKYAQSVKDFMLFRAYDGIVEHFTVADKKEYFQKLQQQTSDLKKLRETKAKYKLDFNQQDQLLLQDRLGETLNFEQLRKKHEGKWLYVDFWASWCEPCLRTMPAAVQLKHNLKNENIIFINLALNDRLQDWKNAIEKHEIAAAQNYRITNGNSSTVLEQLQVNTIPHYLIYNPAGKLINGYAKRPGEGAQKQLLDYIKDVENLSKN